MKPRRTCLSVSIAFYETPQDRPIPIADSAFSRVLSHDERDDLRRLVSRAAYLAISDWYLNHDVEPEPEAQIYAPGRIIRAERI